MVDDTKQRELKYFPHKHSIFCATRFPIHISFIHDDFLKSTNTHEESSHRHPRPRGRERIRTTPKEQRTKESNQNIKFTTLMALVRVVYIPPAYSALIIQVCNTRTCCWRSPLSIHPSIHPYTTPCHAIPSSRRPDRMLNICSRNTKTTRSWDFAQAAVDVYSFALTISRNVYTLRSEPCGIRRYTI